jgi:hypothetical protein
MVPGEISGLDMRTVVLYLTIPTCIDSFQNIVKERIGILESCELDQLRPKHALKFAYDGPSSSGPS